VSILPSFEKSKMKNHIAFYHILRYYSIYTEYFTIIVRNGLMSSEYGSDFVTISDDDGNDFVLEHLDTIEIDDTFYMSFLPTDMDEDDEDYGIVILQVVEEDGEEVLTSIDDDELLEDIYGRFMERLMDEDDEDGEDSENGD